MAKKIDSNQDKEKRKPGLPKGKTNNPNGRPVGAKNKVPNQVKLLLEEWTIDNFEQFKEDYTKLPYFDRAKLYTSMAARFIPRPVSEEEEEAKNRFESEFLKRMFGYKENF